MATATAPGLPEIESARERLDGVARVTPVYPTETFSRLAGRPVLLKAENLQRTGSFKIRGAYVKLSSLEPEQLAAGVVASSAGNHGQAVAWAARELGAPARIYMPQDAPMAKVDATRHYGAEVVLGGSMLEDCLADASAYMEEHGATFVHPYEDPAVIAGQGTLGLELVDQVPEFETAVIPIGGGGLASGIALALRAVKPGPPGSVPAACTPTMRTPGCRARSAIAIPDASPPPPIGITTVPASGACSTSSRPIVPWPAITSGSSNGCTNVAPVWTTYACAPASASSIDEPLSSISAP